MVDVRKGTVKDATLLATMGKETFEEAFAKDNTSENMTFYLEQNFNKAKIISEIKDNYTQFFVAFMDDQPAGYAKVRINDEVKKVLKGRAIELERIYVMSSFQGKKVGASLLQACLDHARGNDFQWIWLGVWENNHKAQNFYAKWGFEKFGEHVFQMGDDPQTDWVMKKQIEK
ncbi:MAG TPA: GNAT family N-acetyltransferase [Cyclobacteriaceae bacterium]